MCMSDPIADMLTRIRNGQKARKNHVLIPCSKQKISIVKVLAQEGFIETYDIESTEAISFINVKLKYFKGKSVIDNIKRISKPGLRVYKSSNNLPKVIGGFGIAIISTSKGIMTDKHARSIQLGGEVICIVN